MALTSSKESSDSNAKEKKEVPPSKVIIRLLPPSLTSETFLEQISPIPKHDYFCYFKADMSLGVHAFSRAYINFVDQDELMVFTEKFDGYVFLDSKGNEYPAVVEFAPFQKVPKRKNRKIDSKKGTIEQDNDYKTFLEQLENPEHEPLPTMESVLEEIETREREKKSGPGGRQTTPLLEYIKKRREEKRAMLMKIKEDKRRKELERKKSRDEERRRQKDSGHGRVSEKERKDDKRGSKDSDKKDNRSRNWSDKEKSTERDVRKDRESKERESGDSKDRESKQDRDGGNRERKTSASDEKRQKGDITVRVLRNPEREKYSSKSRETSKPKESKSDHASSRNDDRHPPRGNTPRGEKSGASHGNRSAGNKDGNRGYKHERGGEKAEGGGKPADEGRNGARQNPDRKPDRTEAGKKRDDYKTETGRARSGSTNKERSDKPPKEATKESRAAPKPAAEGTGESKPESGASAATSDDNAKRTSEETSKRTSEENAKSRAERRAESDRLRRTRNKDRPEREIYVPGRRRAEPSERRPSAEKESKTKSDEPEKESKAKSDEPEKESKTKSDETEKESKTKSDEKSDEKGET